MSKKLEIIGKQDKIDLPDFGLSNIEAKIDTGAYTSSINCSRLKLKVENGEEILTFFLRGSKIQEKKGRKFKTKEFKKRNIRSSNGSSEERYVISTRVEVFGRMIKTEFSLADRSKMKFPVLIGRKFLNKKFIVDVRKKNLSYKLKKDNEDSHTL